jgi:putative addiction module component (TIGR02574 family)
MTRSQILSELLKLSPQDRIQIAEDLWDSLDAKDLPLTDEQATELERRMAELERDPSIGIPWEDVKASLRKKLG